MFSHIELMRYAPGSSMPAHAHDEPSLCLVLSGSYEERILGRSASHGSGSLLCYPGREPHSQTFGTAGAVKLVLTPSVTGLACIAEHVTLATAPSTSSAQIARVAARIAAERATGDSFSPAIIEALAMELVGLLWRGAGMSKAEPAQWARSARDFILAHLDEPISLERLSRAVGAGTMQIARAFRREFGRTPADFQRAARIERAMSLLAHGSMPLSEVAQSCGFYDQSHLSRTFKAELGYTPSAFRRLS